MHDKQNVDGKADVSTFSLSQYYLVIGQCNNNCTITVHFLFYHRYVSYQYVSLWRHIMLQEFATKYLHSGKPGLGLMDNFSNLT